MNENQAKTYRAATEEIAKVTASYDAVEKMVKVFSKQLIAAAKAARDVRKFEIESRCSAALGYAPPRPLLVAGANFDQAHLKALVESVDPEFGLKLLSISGIPADAIDGVAGLLTAPKAESAAKPARK